jgi:hypothetical protein
MLLSSISPPEQRLRLRRKQSLCVASRSVCTSGRTDRSSCAARRHPEDTIPSRRRLNVQVVTNVFWINYLIHYLFISTLPNSPGSLSPACISAAAEALHGPVFAKLLQHVTNHVHANAGTFPLQIRNIERSGGSFHSSNYEPLLLTARHAHVAGTPFKFLVAFLERVEQIVDVMPRVVLPLVPAVRPSFSTS